jgi:hypothetical protein
MNRCFLRIDPVRRTALSRLCTGLLLVLWTLFSGAKAHGQKDNVPECTQAMLDVSMLLPSKDASSAPAGLFAVTFRNRDSSICNFSGVVPGFSGDHESLQFPYARAVDNSDEARLFKSANHRLAPGEQVHLTFGWSAVPAIYQNFAWGGCSTYEDLTLSLERNGDPKLLRTHHLWLRSCGGVWVSSLRAGPFLAEESVPAEWLDSYKISLGDVARPVLPSEGIPPLSLRTIQPVEYLKSTFESGYAEFMVLLLSEQPSALATCPFLTLQRREADGENTIYVNHCTSITHGSTAIQDGMQELLLRDYDLLAQRTGHVEYRMTTLTGERGKPAIQTSEVSFDVRNPNQPMLPVVKTPVPECTAGQLVPSPMPVDLGDHWSSNRITLAADGQQWQDGRAFQVTNNSAQTCRLGGLPDVRFFIPGTQPSNPYWVGEICRNCASSLFQPRESDWIDLLPAESAHFLVAITLLPQRLVSNCAFLDGADLKIGDTKLPRLPFNTAACGQITVSAWRSGVYDHDPLNLAYDRHLSSQRQHFQPSLANVPTDCRKNVSEETGTPVMFLSSGDLEWGLSTRTAAFNQGIPVTVWVHNRSDKPVSIFTCGDVENYLYSAFDVLDSSGRLVLTQREADEQKAGKALDIRARGVMACNSNVTFPVAPHSCISGSLTRASPFFTIRLDARYAVAPGTYFLVPPPVTPPGQMPAAVESHSGLPSSGPILPVTITPE